MISAKLASDNYKFGIVSLGYDPKTSISQGEPVNTIIIFATQSSRYLRKGTMVKSQYTTMNTFYRGMLFSITLYK